MEIKKLYQINSKYTGSLRFTYHLAREELSIYPYDVIISRNEYRRNITKSEYVDLLKVF